MIKSLFTPKPAIYCRDFQYLFLDFWCFILWLKSSKTAKRLRNKLVLPQKKQKFWQLFNIFKSWQNKQFTFCTLLCFFSMIFFVTFAVKEATFFCCIKVLNNKKIPIQTNESGFLVVEGRFFGIKLMKKILRWYRRRNILSALLFSDFYISKYSSLR